MKVHRHRAEMLQVLIALLSHRRHASLVKIKKIIDRAQTVTVELTLSAVGQPWQH